MSDEEQPIIAVIGDYNTVTFTRAGKGVNAWEVLFALAKDELIVSYTQLLQPPFYKCALVPRAKRDEAKNE